MKALPKAGTDEQEQRRLEYVTETIVKVLDPEIVASGP